jgi:hypothetical protein
MKKVLTCGIAFVVLLAAIPIAVKLAADRSSKLTREPVHKHAWGNWQEPIDRSERNPKFSFVQLRSCTNCGFSEFRQVTESKK